MDTKQVIVIRKDLKMSRGKEIAQGSHASMAFITRQINNLQLTEAEDQWLKTSFKKITLQVDSEQALLDIYNRAKDAGLTCHLVEDSGLTYFHGVPTKTCLAIGPNYSNEIDEITGDLKLY